MRTVKIICDPCDGAGIIPRPTNATEAEICKACCGRGCVELEYRPFLRLKILPAVEVVLQRPLPLSTLGSGEEHELRARRRALGWPNTTQRMTYAEFQAVVSLMHS